jgi:hypothetical protein
MQGMLGLTNYTKAQRILSSSAANAAGSVESAAVAVANARCFSFIVLLGAITGIGRVIVQGQLASGGWEATEGVSGDWAATDDEGMIQIDVIKPHKWDELRVSIVTDSGVTDIDGVLCVRSDMRSIPPGQDATVIDASVAISPIAS